jgi:hypothetical protein
VAERVTVDRTSAKAGQIRTRVSAKLRASSAHSTRIPSCWRTGIAVAVISSHRRINASTRASRSCLPPTPELVVLDTGSPVPPHDQST